MFLMSDDGTELSAANRRLGLRCLETLKKHYPAYAAGWEVDINSGGILYIRNTLLTGRMGCCIRTKTLDGDPNLLKVMRYGGELLERHRMARGRALSEQQVLGQLEDAPRSFTGEIIAET